MIRFFWLFGGWAMCGPPPATYRIQRVATVPTAVAPIAPGGGAAGSGVAAGFFGPMWQAPTLDGQSEAGLAIPRHQLALEPRVAVTKTLELRFAFESGELQEPTLIREGAIPPARNRPWGLGMGMASRSRWGDLFYGTIGWDMLVYDIPSRVRVTCVEECGYALDLGDSIEHEAVVVLRAQSAIGIEGEGGYGFLLFGIRTQPTNDGFETSTTTEPPSRDPEVSTGSPYGILGLGGAIRLVDEFELLLMLWAPLGNDPIAYGPAGSIGLAWVTPKE